MGSCVRNFHGLYGSTELFEHRSTRKRLERGPDERYAPLTWDGRITFVVVVVVVAVVVVGIAAIVAVNGRLKVGHVRRNFGIFYAWKGEGWHDRYVNLWQYMTFCCWLKCLLTVNTLLLVSHSSLDAYNSFCFGRGGILIVQQVPECLPDFFC